MNKKADKHHLPRWSTRLLRFFIRPEYREEIEGDMEEIFSDDLERLGIGKAKFSYNIQVFKLLRTSLIKRFIKTPGKSPLGVFKHHLVLSIRGFKRFKTAFLINLTGLSSGLAAALCIFLWVQDERGVDKFHKNDARLFQVMQNMPYPGGLETDKGSPALLAKALVAEIPEVEYAVTVNNRGIGSYGILSNDEDKLEANGIYASADFFQTFSYPLIEGNAAQVLQPKNAVLLSESSALKLFGTTTGLVGQVLEGNRALMSENYVITGVFENPPVNSTLQFDFVINYETVFDKVEWVNLWSGDGARTYITTKPGTDAEQLDLKIRHFLSDKPHREDDELFLQPYSSVYLHGKYENGKVAGGRIAYVRLLSAVGLFIILIASINFMNLSTAQATRRMKEVGVKKVLGVKRSVLIGQFLTESILITVLSFVLAILIVWSFLPVINELTAKQLQLQTSPDLLRTAFAILTLTGLLSGLYPAFYLSGFRPIRALKGQLTNNPKSLWVRKGLVMLQFIVSIVFITGFWIVDRQISFIHNTELGYDREHMVHFKMRQNMDRQPLLNELRNIPGVVGVTNSWGGSIVNMGGSGSGFSWGDPVNNEKMKFRRPQVGYDFVETMGIELITGRTFSREFANEQNKLIVNEAAAEIIGKENIVGRTIMDGSKEKEIIGVVSNFKIKSLYEEMAPCIIRFAANGWDIVARINPEHQQQTLAQIEAVYDSFNPDYPFTSRFLEDEYEALYASEQRIAILSRYFTFIAILISCLGLFGLATFSAERRRKEIGIRKTLGASAFKIVQLLCTDLTKTVLAAIILALPLSYFITKNWLDNFAYHIHPSGWFFIGGGFAAILIAWFTIGLRSYNATRLNPAICLRNE